MKKYFLIILLIAQTCLAQQPVRDTSFTIQSTYFKEAKARPYIKIASPSFSENIISKYNIIYRNIGGRELLLDIFYPNNKSQKKPSVLLIFGGGWKSGDKMQNYAMAAELTKHNYVAVSAEYRLSLEAIYPAAVYDLKAVIRWMRAHANEYGIDANHIAVMGTSAGGQLAALIGTTNGNSHFEDTTGNQHHSSSVQATIDIDGILAFHHPESQESTSASLWLGGTYEQKPELWEEASALNHVDKKTVPFLFLNSSLPRFHAGRNDMIAKMNKLGIYAEVHEFPDTPHPFWFFHPWFDPMMKYAIDFLNKTFKR